MNRERDHLAMQRAQEAYRLWLRGYSFLRIAREIGYTNQSAARKAWERGRKMLSEPEDLLAERDRERERLEIAYAGIAQRVESGDDWAIDRAVAIAERKAKLLGLDRSSADGAGLGLRAKRIVIVDADSVPLPPTLAGLPAPAPSFPLSPDEVTE